MYKNDLGVLQDNALAHMWYNLSAANGNDLGGKNRNEVAIKMTSEEIFTAKAMARKCMSSDYKDCGEWMENKFFQQTFSLLRLGSKAFAQSI